MRAEKRAERLFCCPEIDGRAQRKYGFLTHLGMTLATLPAFGRNAMLTETLMRVD